MMSKYRKLAQIDNKTTYDWVGKVIHQQLCKKLKLDHTIKLYMHNLKFVLENVMHKHLWDFE